MLKDLDWYIYKESFNLVLTKDAEDISALLLRVTNVKETSPLLPVILSEWARTKLELKDLVQSRETWLYKENLTEWSKKFIILTQALGRLEGSLATLIAIAELEYNLHLLGKNKETTNVNRDNILESGIVSNNLFIKKTTSKKQKETKNNKKNTKNVLDKSFKSKFINRH